MDDSDEEALTEEELAEQLFELQRLADEFKADQAARKVALDSQKVVEQPGAVSMGSAELQLLAMTFNGKEAPELEAAESVAALELPESPSALSSGLSAAEAHVPAEDTAEESAAHRFEPIVLRGLVSAEEAARLVALRHSVRPVCREKAGDPHAVIYLHAREQRRQAGDACVRVLDGLVQRMREADPRRRERAAAARAAAGASAAEPSGLGVRCVELHEYSVGAELMDEMHIDLGSQLTLSLMLAEPGSFDGGVFRTWCDAPSDAANGLDAKSVEGQRSAEGGGCGAEQGCWVRHDDLNVGDAMLICSEQRHTVTPVTSGTRHALVIELWDGPSRGLQDRGYNHEDVDYSYERAAESVS